ncbi:helicase HerA-like domain-containing protein [Ketogulonicigenium vulgare]|uniref:Helicase HerA-like C-terminal domain-containing protein n=1 Tax=Ketogulonicigenium vulgare (strain WSH-001) TaxID=759362 RepID=F9Y3R2_KETVW|nr:helicase HerA-like domain-containing protein [Ketogulonicigenium vulgare]AEM40426.1 protein of unknown function DUF853 NPT hydrolase putative [Ketogulonicigenium vulgare WSH-001]ALJ80615.1 ATP-binding protein [Ketogulonicigenium vulgare]ANW33432.1 ATP-binding protein [Ketogulonicigenium vulgare]AOZ54141.1 ATPase [Ketogulonicigenium vulgare]
MATEIFIGGGGDAYGTAQNLLLAQGNRHELIAGATGTGKTVTLQIMTEAFSAAGVPVFLTDIKGDLAGLSQAGVPDEKLRDAFAARATQIGFDLQYQAFPVTFWDVYGKQGHPVRATVAEMGPLLLSRLLGLSDVQEGVLNILFRVADEQGLPLLDLTDLQAMLVWCGQNARDLSLQYGNVSTASVGAIQRALLILENQGALQFFGEPALELDDLMRVDAAGRGMVNILASDQLMQAPRLYATFLLWLMSELFETLPEVGNPDKPKLVLFFDEAHLLFDDAPKVLVDKIEQVARLIRSKGVGVYFVTQNPQDVPDSVLGQLGNRIQHALRAFTAKDRRDLQKAAETYRDNPRFKTADAISQVGTGEAVTSLLDRKGSPQMAERTLIRPPQSRNGTITVEERQVILQASDMAGKYDKTIDRESAREMLAARAALASAEADAAETEATGEFTRARRYNGGRSQPAPSAQTGGADFVEAFKKAAVKELSGTTGRRIMRGVFGTLFKGR